MQQDPFRLPLRPRFVAALAGRALGLEAMSRIYRRRPAGIDTHEFLQFTLDSVGVSTQVNFPDRLDAIPRQGPLVIVANHPLGGLEGVAIARLLAAIRPDLKVLTNELLCRIPELAQMFIGVDVLSAGRARKNIGGVRRVHAHLEKGGALLIFPAGIVATYEVAQRSIVDKPWNRLVGQLVRRHACDCVPIHVGGRNSRAFYLAGLIHPRLRTLLLGRQLLNKRGSVLPLTIGERIPHAELASLHSSKAITEYLRISTEALGGGAALVSARARAGRTHAGFAADVQQDQLQQAIMRLEDCRLLEHRDFDVYCAPFQRLGVIMDQIAISREMTFRMVGEGTGKDRDSDEFDPHYLHLFLWDKAALRVAGAYRIGLVDEIVRSHGVKGLYSRSLYRYNRQFISQLGAAVEMGRSFIHPDYQRRPLALNLLWRGIGVFLVRNPAYHTLFGSVSISREYTDLARALIADTLLTNYRADDYQDLVRPITPHRIRHRVWTSETLTALANVKILSKLVGRCDPGKAVPVLLRHYLSLNGRLVCFNIHSQFNDSLEGLIIVDVRRCEAKTAVRFMGEAGYNRFLEAHRLEKSA